MSEPTASPEPAASTEPTAPQPEQPDSTRTGPGRLLVEVGIIVARLASGERPAQLATLIGYLIAMPIVPVVAAFWGLVERSRWGPAVIAVAGLVAAVLMVRLHQIWPAIHV